MIRVVVADDSATLRRFILRSLESTGRISVCGLAADGEAALKAVRSQRPDVVIMDISMPGIGGVEATCRIMEESPLPIVVFASVSNPTARKRAVSALAVGAVALVPKPDKVTTMGEAAVSLLHAVEVASEAKLITRRRPNRQRVPAQRELTPAPRRRRVLHPGRTPLVAVGASTGGPSALRQLFAGIPGDFLAPVLVVQHISRGFLAEFINWLDGEVPQRVEIAQEGRTPEAGHIYFAPEDRHLKIRDGRIALVSSAPRNRHRPSVDVLFESVAESCGSRSIGVLLTGMGEDGARGLLAIRKAGGKTLAQDEASCVVFGMPRAARDCKAVAICTDLATIPLALTGTLHGLTHE